MTTGNGGTGAWGNGQTRREALKRLAVGVAAVGATNYGLPDGALAEFVREISQGQYQWKFFTAPQLAMMRPLADLVIPRDEKGPSATETGSVEWADFRISISGDQTKDAWRTGLQWLDAESERRFQKGFAASSDAERRQILDDIAFPRRASEANRDAARWFNRVRDLIATAHFSSQPGVEDLGYIGGVFNPEWRGAPPEALAELNLSYEEWDRKYGSTR